MPTARSLIAGLALALTAVSCTDKGPTNPTNSANAPDQQTPAPAVQGRAALLTNVAASGPLFTGTIGGVLTPTGNRLAGTFTITHLDFNRTTGMLEADGVFNYTNPNTGLPAQQTFTDVPATLTRGGSPTSPVCDILTLNLGPLHLDLLGLVVDLDEVNLAITAVSGAGNLLGNLLCAVAGLLDGVGSNSALAAAITNLLNTINGILAGL